MCSAVVQLGMKPVADCLGSIASGRFGILGLPDRTLGLLKFCGCMGVGFGVKAPSSFAVLRVMGCSGSTLEMAVGVQECLLV